MKLIFVDRTPILALVPAAGAPRPDELLLISTGEQLVDGEVRRYYATPPPLRLLLVLRADCLIEDMRIGQMLAALVGWDEGDNAHVLPHGRMRRHTKLTVERILDMNDDLPDDPVIALSAILAKVPRSDRTGGNRSDELGRPPIVAGDSVEAHNITLPSRMWRRIEDIGRGNRSAGVRALFERNWQKARDQMLQDTEEK